MDPKLTAYYRGSVSRRIPVLLAARERLLEEDETAAVGEEIRQIAHALKGTGRSYGVPEVSDAAEAVEDAPPEADLSPVLDRLLEVLHGVAGSGDPP